MSRPKRRRQSPPRPPLRIALRHGDVRALEIIRLGPRTRLVIHDKEVHCGLGLISATLTRGERAALAKTLLRRR